MANKHDFEKKIRNMEYKSEGRARAAIRRSGVTKYESARLNALISDLYVPADDGTAVVTDIPRTLPRVAVGTQKVDDFKANGTPPGLDRLAFNVALYAAQHTLKLPEVLKQIAARVQELT